jgi:2'-5' RNA ligase
VYSLNVPVPSEVSALASRLARELPQARPRSRGEHTFVLKRLTGEREARHTLVARAREELADTNPFQVRITGVDYFGQPTSGPGPVVYLAVDSPDLERLHYNLATTFDPVEGIEGQEYTPHVTVARDGAEQAAHRIAERSIEPIEWTVTKLVFYDGDRSQRTSRVSLSA